MRFTTAHGHSEAENSRLQKLHQYFSPANAFHTEAHWVGDIRQDYFCRKGEKMSITIRKLPSGFWAVFVGETFFDAASTTEAQAQAIADALRETLEA